MTFTHTGNARRAFGRFSPSQVIKRELDTMVALTIGMAVYNDFDGVYFTLQALRLYQDLDDTELLVVDNYGCEDTRGFVEGWAKGRYIRATDAVGTAAPRDRVFREAQGAAVLCCDSHVMFVPGAIARLKAYYRDHPGTRDLLQGPLLADDLHTVLTHQDPIWNDEMWGIWATDPRGLDPEGEPFEIPMQGLGVFSCRKDAWLGFNPAFRGFGGEEGYIHEKVRQAGARCLCLPWLRWGHRFSRPGRIPYHLAVEDKLRNYIIGHTELGLDLEPIKNHFAEYLPEESITAIVAEALADGISTPPKSSYIDITDNSRGALPDTDQEENLPLVSCICPTYGRPPDRQYLIEEAIESFLRQTYPNKELIVLNDCGAQELDCDAPGVQVINMPDRLPSLGDKRNAGVLLSAGEFIAPWDDDDISLPWRLSHSVERLHYGDYYNPLLWWLRDGNGLQLSRGVGHNMSMFRRSAWESVGGHPSMTLGEDQVMDERLRENVRFVSEPQPGTEEWPPSERFYIYRWGVSQLHLSTQKESWENTGKLPIEPGRFELHPHWRRDYVEETRLFLEEHIADPVL
jgi:glycosyltransferase involved in cell wall biosynthesis